jgi:hypothetical protein
MSIPLIAKVVHEKTDRTGTFLSACSDCNNIFAEYDHVDYCFNNYLSRGHMEPEILDSIGQSSLVESNFSGFKNDR